MKKILRYGLISSAISVSIILVGHFAPKDFTIGSYSFFRLTNLLISLSLISGAVLLLIDSYKQINVDKVSILSIIKKCSMYALVHSLCLILYLFIVFIFDHSIYNKTYEKFPLIFLILGFVIMQQIYVLVVTIFLSLFISGYFIRKKTKKEISIMISNSRFLKLLKYFLFIIISIFILGVIRQEYGGVAYLVGMAFFGIFFMNLIHTKKKDDIKD
jgi:hypothetical protein